MPTQAELIAEMAEDLEHPAVRHALQVEEYSGWPPEEDDRPTLLEFAQLPKRDRFRLMAQWDAKRLDIATAFYAAD